MRVEHRPKDEGWRPRGRPFKEVPIQILETVRETYGTDIMGVVEFEETDTPEDIKEMISILKAAGRQLAGYTRIQKDMKHGQIRFILEDKDAPEM